MKRLKKGHAAIAVDAAGHPLDVTGHRTDLPPLYSRRGERLWRAEELTYALGERVRATTAHHRMALGECGTIVEIPEFIRREYIVLPDSLADQFQRQYSGLYLSRMPEHLLAPER
ncbi:MAG TPA: hypothetical protein VF867_16120 [Arthrobacter sp.]